MDDSVKYEGSSHRTVIFLTVFLICLLLLLFLFYKKLNKDTDGEYTIHRMVYKEGGVRDQARGVALALETRLGIRLWPRSDSVEVGEEMQEVHIEERQLQDGSSQGSDSEGDQEDEEGEEEVRTRDGGDSSGDNSSLRSSEGEERTPLTDQPDEMEDEREEKEEKTGDEGGKGEASGGPGLLIDLKQFSGSATWSEGGVYKDGDITAL